mgnify:CR=1 FL=1
MTRLDSSVISNLKFYGSCMLLLVRLELSYLESQGAGTAAKASIIISLYILPVWGRAGAHGLVVLTSVEYVQGR